MNTAGGERAPFLTWEFPRWHRVSQHPERTPHHGATVESNVFLKTAYFADDRPAVRWIEERTTNHWSDGASLGVVILMSLGLWATAWEVIASLASALLR
jgi:hypothetical protein